ncbi:mannose-1-phosphate guanylyltransferase [Oscillospiraceae bacterium]|nr:mannose-1-phosphate guanylyltransferase [Oscillospiraceae bacterium]BDF73860.1 mannose-1-phosphate guanylyltransferase [Oscillospiraceae bacterium]
MKAVIMAGGEGTRLRPLSLGQPKPMTPLFDRPVMEHIIALLRRSGITDIAVTLQYLPGVVKDYFGGGGEQGVRLEYFVEREPLGTAGSVKNCMDWLGEEDFLVISGDAVCDLDLSAALAFHRTRRSAATLVLCRHPAPLEYGLVITDEEGRIERFIEKPSWGQVFSNQVNTGIYVLTRAAMDRVPEGKPYDFGKDLFPALLAQGEAMYGHVAEGYWCDMGDCAAYLSCVADALSGKVRLDLGAPRVAPGVWSASPIPPSVQVVPPCYIGPGVVIGAGSLIGPHAALGAGSTVGERCLVQRCVLHAAHVGDRATLYGAIMCKGARAGRGAVLNEGAVLGENAALGEEAIALEGVKVWPNRTVADGARLAHSVTTGGLREPLRFADGGIIRGAVGEELTPELLVLLGNCLGAEGQLGLGSAGGDGAGMLERAAASGAAAGGCRVLESDAPCASAAGWLAGYYGLPAVLFAEQEGERGYLHVFDGRGLPPGRARERKLEGAALRAEVNRVPAGRVGAVERVTGVGAAYAADAARRARIGRAPLRPVRVAVPGGAPADRVLAEALERLGCTVLEAAAPGVPVFRTGRGGFTLSATDEEGEALEPEQLLAIAALIEYEDGGGRVAVPAGAPAALDTLAAGYGSAVLRLERDGREAEELYAALPWLRDGVFAACRICARMGLTGERLRALSGKIPRFRLRRRELAVAGGRGELMQALAQSEASAASAGEGLRVKLGSGWVWLSPLTRRSALRVVGEGPDMELAAELCDFYVKKARALDKGRGPEK